MLAAAFKSTRWTGVLRAGKPDAPEARTALAGLCEDYWPPFRDRFRTEVAQTVADPGEAETECRYLLSVLLGR